MQFVTEEEEDRTLPEDSIHIARLEECKLREFEWFDYKSNETKTGRVLEWWWQIVSSNEDRFVGRKVKGQCNAKLTSRDDNKCRLWAEALLHRDIPVGMGVDTDDLVGLEAEIVIGHRPDRKDKTKVWEEVAFVNAVDRRQQEEPPF